MGSYDKGADRFSSTDSMCKLTTELFRFSFAVSRKSAGDGPNLGVEP